MLELYHNALSTCSQKVRLTMVEKELSFDSHLVDLVGGGQHEPAFVAVSPKHEVPILLDDGNVIRESSIINEYLEDIASTPALSPSDPYERAQMRLWIKRVDEDIHGHTCGVFTHTIWTHRIIGARSEEEVEMYIGAIPDPDERDFRRSLITKGVEAPEFLPALTRMSGFLDDLNVALAEQPWLAGEQFSLADICVIPYVARLENTGLAGLWEDARRPHLASWFDAVQARPSYKVAFTDWIPEPMREGLSALTEMSADLVSAAIVSVDASETK